MNREDIIRMEREALLNGLLEVGLIDYFERFAALVAAAEREACAKVVENYAGAWDDQGYALSQAIRARGQE
jgi:hypothetical protein